MPTPNRNNERQRRQSHTRRPSEEPDTPTPKRKPRQSQNEGSKEEGSPKKSLEQQQRRRKGHRATSSTGELLLPNHGRRTSTSSPRHSRQSDDPSSSSSSGMPLKLNHLEQLNALYQKKDRKSGWNTYDQAYLHEVRTKEIKLEERRKQGEKDRKRRNQSENNERTKDQGSMERERRRSRSASKRPSEMVEIVQSADIRTRKQQRYERLEDERRLKDVTPKKKKRVISGPYLEDGRAEEVYRNKRLKKKRTGRRGSKGFAGCGLTRKGCIFIGLTIGLVVVIVIIAVAIILSKKKSSTSTSSSSSPPSGNQPSNSNLNGISPDSIPSWAKGGYLDPFHWYDTVDFNVTFTNATVGGLYIMGLNSTWDDSVQANSNVPPLNQAFQYGSMPIRGINLGGWFSLEPFITPSFFTKANVIDEWTLTTSLGTSASSTLEKHYSSFITKQDFSAIRSAGFDHVRISFSYWAVTTYSGDPYVPMISWRYLLRAIEYCRQNGLRVNLDLHGAPGSQNGWNHSGRQGEIRWLNGTDGDLNAQRTLDIHNQLSQFFSQPRYKNMITLYGLVNEPRMVFLNTTQVLDWSEKAIETVRGNNLTSILVFGDGFLGLDNWKGKLQNYNNLLLDVHQYVIFNDAQISLNHSAKLNFACAGWTAQMLRSQNKATGFGPTMCGEWSQADTDCTQFLNDVGVGSRWQGTLNDPDPSLSVLSPQCPGGSNCECTDANADPSNYSAAYKQWLLYFALAQMESFEEGWGWFYWTWATESATQWSYKLGLAAGILPTNVADRSAFNCNSTIPDFSAMGLPEVY